MNNMKYKLDVTMYIAATSGSLGGSNEALSDLVREAVLSFMGMSNIPCNAKITRFLKDLKVIVLADEEAGIGHLNS